MIPVIQDRGMEREKVKEKEKTVIKMNKRKKIFAIFLVAIILASVIVPVAARYVSGGRRVGGPQILSDAIDSRHFADGSIDTAHFADSQITSAKIVNYTIASYDIANNTITAGQIATSGVATAEILDDTIDSADYKNGSIDNEHLSASCVNSSQLIDATIAAADIATSAVNGTHILDDTIDSADYAALSIDNEHLSDDAINSSQIIDDTIDSADYAAGSVDVEHLSVPKYGSISQTFYFANFTDNTDATGHVNFTSTLEAGAIPLGWKTLATEGFTGNTSATIMLGIAGDTDSFSADTGQSVYTSGVTVGSSVLAADACNGINATSTVRVTVTKAVDWGVGSAGQATVTLYYIETV